MSQADRPADRRIDELDAPAPLDPFDAEHEQVVFAHDPDSGLRAIIAIHSTALGPALGGTRFHPYRSTAEALRDVLALSRGMSFKAAVSGLDLGGGKAVIIGDPTRDKSEALLRAYGRFVESLGGRYVTACDVGTYSVDMDLVGRETRHATGRTVEVGGAGDSSVLTAYGVFRGMLAAAEHAWPDADPTAPLAGRTVGVAGVGKVGRHLVGHLVEAGARVVVTDVSAAAVTRVCDEHPAVSVAGSTEALVASDLDVYAPCALGGALSAEVLAVLSAKVVCGAANNQLAHPGVDKLIEEAGVVYAPDFVVNAGGLIQVADERSGAGGFDMARAHARTTGIYDTTRLVLERAAVDAVPTGVAADRIAEQRMREVGRLRGLWLG